MRKSLVTIILIIIFNTALYSRIGHALSEENNDEIEKLGEYPPSALTQSFYENYGIKLDIQSQLPPDSTLTKGGILTIDGTTINLKELNGQHTIEYRNNRLFIDSKEFTNAQNIQSTPDGDGLRVDSVEYFDDDNIQISDGGNVEVYPYRITAASLHTFSDSFGDTLTNAIGVTYSEGNLKADYADSFVKSKSVTTRIEDLNSNSTEFRVKRADFLISEGIEISDINDARFSIDKKFISIETSDNDLRITGKGNYEAGFRAYSGESSLIISKNESFYEIRGARINFSSSYNGEKFKDSIETNSSARIEIDEFRIGIKCAIVEPITTYWYNDEDIRKDFGINIPSNGSRYKLCIRRYSNAMFGNYDGLVDFPEKRILLSGIANYLKYPFKQNRASSLLMDNMGEGIGDFNITIQLDRNFILADSVKIWKTDMNQREYKTIIRPNNFYTIREKMMRDGSIHRMLRLNPHLSAGQLSQGRIRLYGTDYFSPGITIRDNVLTQKSDGNLITILPPGSVLIGNIFNWR